MRKPALDRIPREIAAAADYEGLSAQHLQASTLAWVAGGSGDELTLRANRSAFSRVGLRNRLWGFAKPAQKPEQIAEANPISTALDLLGQNFAHPLLLAPVATQALLHPQAELASAQGAEAMNVGMVLSTLASTTLEAVAAEVSRRWLQLYWQQTPKRTLALVRRAEQSGYTALVLTLDTPVQSLSRGAQRLGFQIPAHLRAVNLEDLPQLPRPPDPLGTGVNRSALEGLLRQAATLEDVRFLVRHTHLPVLIKGILHAEDARMLLECGVQGFVVSNHGGRALASAGALGVAHMLKIVLEELQLCMALCGCATLAEIGPHNLVSLQNHSQELATCC